MEPVQAIMNAANYEVRKPQTSNFSENPAVAPIQFSLTVMWAQRCRISVPLCRIHTLALCCLGAQKPFQRAYWGTHHCVCDCVQRLACVILFAFKFRFHEAVCWYTGDYRARSNVHQLTFRLEPVRQASLSAF